TPDKPLAEVLGEMFAVDGYLLSSLIACGMCAAGVGYLLKGVLGPPYQEDQPVEYSSEPGAADVTSNVKPRHP
ncbi:MAG TPA: hypothetical protein VKD72_19175, partial [Gemmataceae bacterium]|nr:hypothetical protein [Gemmataceae bacterium]